MQKKEIKTNNYFYLAKQDLKKIDKNLTLKEAKIENNETLFILEDKNNNNNCNNEKDSLNKEIIFYINYEGVSYSFSGFKENTFIDCIKSFTEDNGEKNFIINNKIIDINKTLNELCVNNGDVIKVGEIEKWKTKSNKNMYSFRNIKAEKIIFILDKYLNVFLKKILNYKKYILVLIFCDLIV